MSETEKTKKLFYALLLLLVSTIIITLCAYKQEIELISLQKENESLKGKIEYQKSVIMDLEENLRGNL